MAEQVEECGQGGKGDEDWLSPESERIERTMRRGGGGAREMYELNRNMTQEGGKVLMMRWR